MKIGEFFKPNPFKIYILVIFYILWFVIMWIMLWEEGQPSSVVLKIIFNIFFAPAILFDKYFRNVGFPIILIFQLIYFYLISCIIYAIYSYFKNKKVNTIQKS